MCPLPLKTVVCFLGSELGRESLAQRPRKLAVCLVLNWSFQSYLFIFSLLTHHLDTQGRQLFSLWPSHDVFLVLGFSFSYSRFSSSAPWASIIYFPPVCFPRIQVCSWSIGFLILEVTYIYYIHIHISCWLWVCFIHVSHQPLFYGESGCFQKGWRLWQTLIEWLILFNESSTGDQHKVTWASFRAYSGIHQCAWCFECLKVAWHKCSARLETRKSTFCD